MEQQPNKFIAVAYELFTIDEDGTAHKEQEVNASEPFSFISGFGITHKEFENNIYPLQKGDNFDFTLSPELEELSDLIAFIPVSLALFARLYRKVIRPIPDGRL